MNSRIVTEKELLAFEQNLYQEEKSTVTVEKYLRDVRAFLVFAGEGDITRETVIAFKNHLLEGGYAASSINSMLASLNSLLSFLGWQECKAKNIRQQRQTYCHEDRELTKEEYKRLLEAARNKQQLYLVMQTLCGTGIRISELQYFTVDAVRRGEVTIYCKSKARTILVPGQLKRLLLQYAEKSGIQNGPIFITRSGHVLNRSNVWAQMKKLCEKAGVKASKVYPHNLRKLFAKTFYSLEKDIAKLADILGHSSINTTRIYIMTTGSEHRRKIENLGLIL